MAGVLISHFPDTIMETLTYMVHIATLISGFPCDHMVQCVGGGGPCGVYRQAELWSGVLEDPPAATRVSVRRQKAFPQQPQAISCLCP